jgi:hypothetical protein
MISKLSIQPNPRVLRFPSDAMVVSTVVERRRNRASLSSS